MIRNNRSWQPKDVAVYFLGIVSWFAFQSTAIFAADEIHDGDQVTYAGEVARIINENCVVCHREGGIGPMELTSYENVRPWAPLIQLRVANREMPPYAYDHDIGNQNLQGDWRLSQEDIDTVVAWVEQGSLMGNPEELPPAPQLKNVDAWNFADQLGEPDIVLASVPIDVPANGNDLWDKHFIDSGISEDRCIKALQVKPRGDAKSVVHHANTYFAEIAEDGSVDRKPVTEYAMGKWGEIVPEGVCRTAFADSMVQWDIHMYPGGLGGTAPTLL